MLRITLKSKTDHGIRQPYRMLVYQILLLSGTLMIHPFLGFSMSAEEMKSIELWKNVSRSLSTLTLMHKTMS
jgi:hypothetical protein